MNSNEEDQFGHETEIGEKCAVMAAYDLEASRNVAPYVIEGLLSQNHRGQMSSGIARFDPENPNIVSTYSEYGLVSEVFRLNQEERAAEIMKEHGGVAMIGHNRYMTSGHIPKDPNQPSIREHALLWKWFAFAINGNIANYRELIDRLVETGRGYHFKYKDDIEVLKHYLAHFNRGENPVHPPEIFERLQEQIDGACNMVYINAQGDLCVYRDKKAFRPLNYGVTKDNIFLAASESNAIRKHVKEVIAVRGGELIMVSGDKRAVSSYKISESDPSCCFEEDVYFSDPASNIDGRPVAKSRIALGKLMGKIEDQKLDKKCVVIHVPESGMLAAKGYAEATGMRERPGIIRNRFVGRTFISTDAKSKARLKYSYIPSEINSKRVFITDDSLINGTTIFEILEGMVAECDPAEIHVRITSPPITNKCYYGLAISDRKNLFAAKYMDRIKKGEVPPDVIAEMIAELNKHAKGKVKSLKFLPPEFLSQAIGLKIRDMCRACITGEYPTPFGRDRQKSEL